MTRALRQLSEYGIGLSPNDPNPENAVRDLVSFLPVLAYDGANTTQIDAGGILDIAMAGTSATLLARKCESALLVNVDNDTLRRILDTRIPASMYLTDFRENTLQDVITKLEPDLFQTVTGLTVKDFHLLVRLKVFNTEQMNQAVFAFRRYEDASLAYTGIESHEGLTHYGLYDTVVARE